MTANNDPRTWEQTINNLLDTMKEVVAEKDKRIAELEAQAMPPEVDELLALLEGYITEKEAQMRAGYRYGTELSRIVELYRVIKKEAKSA